LGDVLQLGALSLDTRTREVSIADRVEALPPREVAILEMLLRRAGRVVPKQLVEDHLFGLSAEGGANAIEVYVHRLRRFLDASGSGLRVHTVRGVGYMIAASAG
ncbi:MAG: winged helix-turn-helix domain-containing protein, partial [Acetobacteraceae bacterium]